MNNDNDIVILLEQYLNVMKDEMKNLNGCVNALKNEVSILKTTNTLNADSRSKIDSMFMDMETRLRSLERQDGTTDSCIQTISTDLISYKKLVETRISANEKTISDVSTSVNKIWYAILGISLTIIAKFIFPII